MAESDPPAPRSPAREDVEQLIRLAEAEAITATVRKEQAEAEAAAAAAKRAFVEAEASSRRWYDRVNWTVVSSIAVAGLTVAGNTMIENQRAQASLRQETLRSTQELRAETLRADKELETALILQAMALPEEIDRIKALVFFMDTGMVTDEEGMLRRKAEDVGMVPMVPMASTGPAALLKKLGELAMLAKKDSRTGPAEGLPIMVHIEEATSDPPTVEE